MVRPLGLRRHALDTCVFLLITGSPTVALLHGAETDIVEITHERVPHTHRINKPNSLVRRDLSMIPWSGAWLAQESSGLAHLMNVGELSKLAKERWVGLVDVSHDPDSDRIWLDMHSLSQARTTSAESPFNGTVYISSSETAIGAKRTATLKARCVQENLKCLRMKPIMEGTGWEGKCYGLIKTFLAGMKVWEMNNEDMGLFVEDDFNAIANFGEELSKSMRELPSEWQIFHLCPRRLRLTPNLDDYRNPAPSQGGRVFLTWPQVKGNPPGVLAGGPVAALIKKESQSLVKTAISQAAGAPPNQPNPIKTILATPIDIFFRDLGIGFPNKHFVAATPQLCSER
jgi:hypothetical protein